MLTFNRGTHFLYIYIDSFEKKKKQISEETKKKRLRAPGVVEEGMLAVRRGRGNGEPFLFTTPIYHRRSSPLNPSSSARRG